MFKDIILYIKLASLVIEYGFKLVKYLLKKYDKIEVEAKVVPVTSDDKARVFNTAAASEIYESQKRVASTHELNKTREVVWQAKNPGVVPKPLKDPKLQVGVYPLGTKPH
jgi:histidinol dehydrogenase